MVSKKIILVGDFSTGKTSLIRRFVDNQFSDSYLSTIGVKISRKNILLEKEEVQGLIWDIEGGTQTKPIIKTYLIGAHGCIIVADVNRYDSIENIATYIQTVQNITPNTSFVLALNKSDCLESEDKERLLYEVSEKYNNITSHIYLTSAKTGENVESMFYTLAQEMI